VIRKATTDDIPAIRQMAEVIFRLTYMDILSPEQMDYMMNWMYSEASLTSQMCSRGHLFYIEDGKGYVSFRFEGHQEDGRDLFHLEKLYVMPQFQGTGLGRSLFNKVVECVKQFTNNPGRIELNVNRNNKAVTFYEHLGMHKARTGDFPIGKDFFMNDYIMSMDL
jgi:GNAT superfamily N-acetyltransferase